MYMFSVVYASTVLWLYVKEMQYQTDTHKRNL